MRLIFAFIGAFVLLLAVLGTFGIGNFVLIYGPDKITCTKDAK